MFELAFDALILAALFTATPSANRAGRLLVAMAAMVFVSRLVLAVLGRTQ